MKLKHLIDIFKITIEELKGCWAASKNVTSKVEKTKYYSLLYLNILLLVVYGVPFLFSLYIVAVSFLIGPSAMIGLLFTVPFLLIVLYVRMKIYPVMKGNYLKQGK